MIPDHLRSALPRPWYADGELATLARDRHARRHESAPRWGEWVNVRDHVRADVAAGAVYPADVVDLARLEFISLFAGIGGMDLGLERAGMRCVAQVEIDDYATRVLARHWPDVVRHRDVRHVGAHNLPRADLICGGFPCQDISNAGKRAGLAGERSGLWFEFARVIGELRPRYVLVENVAALLGRGVDTVLGDLAALGYDAEWHCIPAAAVGAPHIRDRVFILAHASDAVRWPVDGGVAGSAGAGARAPQGRAVRQGHRRADDDRSATRGAVVADAHSPRLAERESFGSYARAQLPAFERSCRTGSGQWAAEPNVGRVADGVPARVDRLRGLGNAVVPQVAEFWGRVIVAHAAGAYTAQQHKEAA